MITVASYPSLRSNGSIAGSHTSSKWNLPPEFDTREHASAFYEEGQQALSMQADQPVIGTNMLSDGWQIWRYPAETIVGYNDDQTPKMGPHPAAGKPHKVAGAKPGENFVLMFRSAQVQAEVNHAYGILSIEQMTNEQRGETLSVPGADQSMLTHQQLGGKDIEIEREIDAVEGRSSAVHQQLPTGNRIGKQTRPVSR